MTASRDAGEPVAARPLSLREALIPIASLIGLIRPSFFLFDEHGDHGRHDERELVRTERPGISPFTVFCGLSPLVLIAFAVLGIRMPKLEAGQPAPR